VSLIAAPFGAQLHTILGNSCHESDPAELVSVQLACGEALRLPIEAAALTERAPRVSPFVLPPLSNVSDTPRYIPHNLFCLIFGI
jgi:hypothetical protein